VLKRSAERMHAWGGSQADERQRTQPYWHARTAMRRGGECRRATSQRGEPTTEPRDSCSPTVLAPECPTEIESKACLEAIRAREEEETAARGKKGQTYSIDASPAEPLIHIPHAAGY
jgi:hypothetical protein